STAQLPNHRTKDPSAMDFDSRLAALRETLAPVFRSRPAAFGLTGRQAFLLAISFFVCMVGIANAMLMAIAERFREIATMKCLGATDGCILSLFMMEAAMQGFFGGLIGAATGLAAAIARDSFSCGAYLWRYMPWSALGACFLVSVAAGVLLSALASMQPSWSASRMAPMEAMRVE
ncbi:MAG: ABC transporter permease, partial [Kiritimatiellae bacterium]|nr:ABC transporter permease [Kiritimatiellia bacterium]